MRSVIFNSFTGLNTVSPSTAIINARKMIAGLTHADNVCIDSAFKINCREGYTLKFSGGYKDLWSTDDKGRCYAVTASGDLAELSPDLTEMKILMSGVGAYPMSFAQAGDDIYFTNNILIGRIVDGIASLLPAVTETYKKEMPAGHLIMFAFGHLFTARDNKIYISDVKQRYQYDTRIGFKSFISKIRAMDYVTSGIYISDEKNIQFLNGRNPLKMVHNKISPNPAFEGCMTRVEDIKTATYRYQNAVIWESEEGICIGGEGGNYESLTNDNYVIPLKNRGCLIHRETSEGYSQLIAIAQ